jgi:glycerate 2-kinase
MIEQAVFGKTQGGGNLLDVDKMTDSHQSRLREHAVTIFQSGLRAVAPGDGIKQHCQRNGNCLTVAGTNYQLDQFETIYVIGAGKAGAAMAEAIEDLLGEQITSGLVTVKYGHLAQLNRVTLQEAGHPVPDRNGLLGAQKIFQLVSSANEKSLIICLISGGGSALLPLPAEGITLEDKQKTTKLLLSCGATIHEINTIRKHLSGIKGGGLARAAYPATLITLILSDVIGDDLDSIASGPCVPDPDTFENCQAILQKYEIESHVPASVSRHIAAGIAGRVAETTKAGQEFFLKTQNVIIGSNFKALMAAKEKAERLGYNTLFISSMIEGETRDVAIVHMAIAQNIRLHKLPVQRPACLLSGGETTVSLKGTGKGGRNQEFVLAAALKSAGFDRLLILSAGTDGSDGPTDAAGAFADETTLARAVAAGLNPQRYLKDNDSYHFFESLGDLYKTGPTHTNVMDLRVILIP